MLVQVWNRNKHPFKQQFKDNLVKIAAGAHVVMDYDEAVAFLGSYSPPKYDADGNHQPEGFKMLEIVKKEGLSQGPDPEKKDPEHICIACRYQGADEKDLEEHLKVSHSDQLVKDEQAEEDLARRAKQAKKG